MTMQSPRLRYPPVAGNGTKDPVIIVTTAVTAVITAVSAISRGFGAFLSFTDFTNLDSRLMIAQNTDL